jgi:hypothetical protein
MRVLCVRLFVVELVIVLRDGGRVKSLQNNKQFLWEEAGMLFVGKDAP